MKKLILLTFALVCFLAGNAQKEGLKYKLYKLEDAIIKGNIESLKEMAKYIDDKSFVQEFLGYHNYPNTARGIAIRIIEENCFFTENGFNIDSTISTYSFLEMLNSGKVVFDDLTGMFLTKPIANCKTAYQLKKLSKFDLARVDTTAITSPYPEWYYENQIDGFLINKDPQSLLWIASAWYQKRSRFNRYYFNDEEFLDLMKKLTHLDLGVPDEDGKTTFLYKDDYSAKARLNYLIYWANHFQDYQWNEQQKCFENNKEDGVEKTKEEILFTFLNSENDSIAIDAFSQLAELDTGNVRVQTDAYGSNDIDANFSLPTFPYRFLKQMVLLTQYCRDHGINYKAQNWVLDSLKKLKTEMPYSERYGLENRIIDKLSVDEVTSIEYYGLIYGQQWNLTYSIGRILDKFYSNMFDNIVINYRQLSLFLKKAQLLNRLGIIGMCNKYLKKFENSTHEVISKVQNVFNSTNDDDVKMAARRVIDSYKSLQLGKSVKNVRKKELEKFGVVAFKEKYNAILNKCKKDDCQFEISELLGKVDYKQLGDVMDILLNDTIFSKGEITEIIKNDFGIDADSIEEFLRVYHDGTEYKLYKYYFEKSGIPCLEEDGDFVYEKVYETLKYDIVDAFVGGGGGRREIGIYPLVKLLELKFKTTLGHPEKLCDEGSPGTYNNSTENARSWMKFLEDNKLVRSHRHDPVSISD